MAEDNILQRIKRWKHMSKRPIGRPKIRWEDDVLEDIKSMNVSNWNKVAEREMEECSTEQRERWKNVAQNRERDGIM